MKTGLTAALEQYAADTVYLESVKAEYKALPATIKQEADNLAAADRELAEAQARLTKPLEAYNSRWSGFKRVYISPLARKVQEAAATRDLYSDNLERLKATKKRGLDEYIAAARHDSELAAVNLYNAANVAAARCKVKSPLPENWERLSLEKIKARLAPLAVAEATIVEERKNKKRKVKPAASEDGVTERVKFTLKDGAAVVLPDELYRAVKAGGKSKSDYILLNRGVLVPAAAFIDWLHLVARDAEAVSLRLDEHTKNLTAKIGRTTAMFKGLIYQPDCDNFPMVNPICRCLHRVIFERAA